MSHLIKPVIASHNVSHGSFSTYLTGFAASLVLTVLAFLLVGRHALGRKMLIGVIMLLALTQFLVQAIYFLHLGRETKPRWKLAAFVFMIGIVLTIVVGSLWIMANLDSRHGMTPTQTDKYIINDEGAGQ